MKTNKKGGNEMAAPSTISKPQIKKIWVTARNVGINDEEILRDLIEAITGSRSISKMSKDEANMIIDALNGKDRPGFASSQQVWKINQLAKELGWDNPKRLKAFIKKYYGVDEPRWLKSYAAWKCIESLKKLLTNEKKKALG